MKTRSSCEASAEVTQSPARVDPSPTGRPRKNAGQLVPFLRYPTAVAKAIAALNAMRLTRRSDHVVMAALIAACDKEGLIWAKPREVAVTTGLALNTVNASLRRLRNEGLLAWVRVMPTKRLPRRLSHKVPVQLGRGRRTTSGCRVYAVQWPKFGVSYEVRDLAQDVLDRSNLDRSGSIQVDRSSDPLDLSSRDLKLDCAPGGAGTPPSDGGTENAPPPASNVEPLQSRGSLAAARALPLPISQPAEPPAASSPPASPAAPSAAIARAVGEGASAKSTSRRGMAPSAPHTTPEPRLTAATMLADLAAVGLFRLPSKS